MSGVIGFEIPTIIIAIVFVVHLARSWYSRRHHPNYRVGTRYHCHFYRRLHSCSISKGVVWRWRGGDEIRNTFDEIRHGGVQRRSRTSPFVSRASKLRAVRKSGLLRRASVRAICRFELPSRRFIEDRDIIFHPDDWGPDVRRRVHCYCNLYVERVAQ